MDAYGKDVKGWYFYYNDYLIKSAKRYNTLGDETTKNIYVSTSEQILMNVLNISLNMKKTFYYLKII